VQALNSVHLIFKVAGELITSPYIEGAFGNLCNVLVYDGTSIKFVLYCDAQYILPICMERAKCMKKHLRVYTLSEAWNGVNWADLMAAQGAFGTDFYDRSLLRPKHRAYYRSGRPVVKICPKGALGSHEIRPIHSAPSLGPSIVRPGEIIWGS